MAHHQTTPTVKIEASAESLTTIPPIATLFSPQSLASPAPSTINPVDMMTPEPTVDDHRLSSVPEDQSETLGPSEKKSSKKRKSWGQVLPEPKTNLPPRKRAKTEDEKEQRRVERVLRNRRAAQSSRERKRLEVEALEIRNKELETLLLNAQKANLVLVEELNRFRRDSGVVTRSSSPLDSLRDNPITLSQQLFGSQTDIKASEHSHLVCDLIMSTNPTINPASISPELTPVPDLTTLTTPIKTEAQAGQQTTVNSPDLTQRPAEMLCDLRCHTSAELTKSLPSSESRSLSILAWTLQLRMMLLSASAILSACHRPLVQIAMSSKAGFSLLPTQLLTTIIWLVTLPTSRGSHHSTSTSTTSSVKRQDFPPQNLWQRATMPQWTTDSSPNCATLRFKSLRKILSSSPNLARPLMDATMEALRLVSGGCDDQVEHLGIGSRATRGEVDKLTYCLKGTNLPSREVLLTLLWALRVEQQRLERRNESHSGTGRNVPSEGQPTKFVLKVAQVSRGGCVDDSMTERRLV